MRTQRKETTVTQPVPPEVNMQRSEAEQQTAQPEPVERQQVSTIEPVRQTAPAVDERNLEYQKRRLALGDNPTKEQMDAVRDFGLDLHRQNFPQLHY